MTSKTSGPSLTCKRGRNEGTKAQRQVGTDAAGQAQRQVGWRGTKADRHRGRQVRRSGNGGPDGDQSGKGGSSPRAYGLDLTEQNTSVVTGW